MPPSKKGGVLLFAAFFLIGEGVNFIELNKPWIGNGNTEIYKGKYKERISSRNTFTPWV